MSRQRMWWLGAARAVLVLGGTCSIWWSVQNFEAFATALDLDLVSHRILQTEPYRFEVLKDLAAVPLGASVRPETLREIAIVNERLLELDLLGGKRTAIDDQLVVTKTAIERSLMTAPSDPFLWLSLYWVRTLDSGFTEGNLPLMRMSYVTGPYEGWVAPRRNLLAFIAFQSLPADMSERTLNEFVAIVGAGFHDNAADILVGAAWPQHALLLGKLEKLPLIVKQRFAKRLYDMGYKLDVPGVTKYGDRPWH